MDTIKILKYSTILLAAACIFLAVELAIVIAEKNKIESALKVQQVNEKVLAFNKVFIEKVLQNSAEVSFEDRLELENLVRGLNDAEILTNWERFTASTTDSDAQQSVRNLLVLLANKISY